MPGWSTLLIDLRPNPEMRTELLQRLKEHGVINETSLEAGGKVVGSLAALARAALHYAKEATEGLAGEARALRVDADVIAANGSAQGANYIFLAVDLHGRSIDHDDPAVNGAIRSYLGAYVPLLGRRFVAVSTLLDRIMYAGGLTVVEAASEEEARLLTADDPWRRLYPGRVYHLASGFFQRQLPPAGPGTQRSGGGSPWPFHWATP